MTALLTHQEVMAMDRLNNLFMDKPNPGLDFMFATATADADPGAGYIRLNNSAWGSSTYLYISKTDRNNSPIGPLIGSLMANGSHLRLFPTLDRTMYLEADISGPPVDATTYWKVPLANVIASAAMPILGTLMVVFPAPSGTPGAGYGASSTTSLANAASGSKAFTISSGKAFLPGARIRATSASTGHWMEGVVTAYASTTLTVTMDYSDGNTGTYNDWNINAAGEKGSAGPTGSAGPSGSTGADGTDPGIRFLFASSTAMGDPSAGNVRFNNATPASVTAIAFSYSCGESGNPSVANWIKNLGASTTSGDKGRLIIKKTSAPQNYIIAKITAAVADNATWGQVTVTIDDSAGSFSAADQLSVQWSRTGNQGATGAGTGDFNGPGSSTAHNLVAFADTSGNLGEDAGVAISTDGTLASNSDAKVPTQKAVKTYVDQIVAAQDAMVFKGVIDCSVNPNYPAADRGWTYRVSVAGKIGGASGPNVEAGDVLICLTDSTSSGNHATVGAQWGIVQVNLDGALTTTNATSGTSILKGNGLGGIANATAGTDYSTLNSLTPGAGLTSTLTATAPGSALTATGTLSAAELVNAQTGTSYTVVDGDRAKLVTFSNTAAIAVTLPQAGAASVFQAGWYADFKNNNIGAVTITPTGAIDGCASLVLNQGQGVRIVSDGTNYATTVANTPGWLAGTRNAIVNGAMQVAQRGTSITSSTVFTNNNGNVTLDCWKLFSGASAANANNVASVTQDTANVPTNGLYALGLTVVDNTKKFGICQFIERKNCSGLIGNTVTLSFKAKVSNASAGHITNVKAAVLSWTGTADAPTQPVASTGWGSSGTTPTWATNWTANNTPANLGVTTSWQTFTITVTLNTASTTNIAVMIWSDAFNTTASDVLYITDVQLEPGYVATPFERRNVADEIAHCMRYLFLIGNTGSLYMFSAAGTRINAVADFLFKPPVEMRASPSQITSSPTFNVGTPSANQYALYDNAAANFMTNTGSVSFTTVSTPTKADLNFRFQAATSFTGSNGDNLFLYLGSTASFGYSAEL